MYHYLRPRQRRIRIVGASLLAAHPKWLTAIFNYGTCHGTVSDRSRKRPLRITEIQALLGESNASIVLDFMEAMVVEGLATAEFASNMKGFRIKFASCKKRICHTTREREILHAV